MARVPDIAEIARALDMPAGSPVTVIGSGQNNRVYDFGNVIVRVPRFAKAERDLEREARILTALRPHLPIAVPALELRKVGEYLISVHKKLAGQPILNLDGMSTGIQQELAKSLAGFLRTLHGLPVEYLPFEPATDPSLEWRDLLHQCEAQIFPLLPAAATTRVRQLFSGFLAACDTLPRVIIHGDFGAGNILIDQHRLSGVIDFAGCELGDPAYDFASLAAGFGDAFAESVMSHYPGQVEMRDRMEFYRATFPLLDILFGVEHGDQEALSAGLLAVTGQRKRTY